MKTNRHAPLVTAIFVFAIFSTAGCAEKENLTAAATPPAPGAVSPAVAVTTPPTAGPDVAAADWGSIKDCAYDTRPAFFAGLKGLEAKVDEQFKELTAQRTAMPGSANTKNWDFAMKEMGDARTYLKGMGEETSKATSETWDQLKAKVGQAWERTQVAYAKVKASTTN